MKKKTILYILLDLILLAVFNTVFFVIGGTEHVASVWISYGFIHFSYLMVLLTPLLIRRSSSSYVFGLSLYSVSVTYFFVVFVTGLIFILVASESYKAALVTQVIIAGAYAILLLINLIANEHTADNLEKQEEEVAFIKRASSRVKILIDKIEDKKCNKEIQKIYDALRTSPSKSNSSANIIEENILSKISFLEDAVSSNDIDSVAKYCHDMNSLIEQRNECCRQ